MARPTDLHSELFLNEPDKALFDLGVARHRGSASGDGVGIDVMTFAMTVKMTPLFDKRTDEVAALHTSTPSSSVCAPACAGSDSESSSIR